MTDKATIENDGVTSSMNIEDLTLDQLVQLSQGFGHQIEQLRANRAYLKHKIDERLRQLERTGDEGREQGRARMLEALAKMRGDASAPGATVEISARG